MSKLKYILAGMASILDLGGAAHPIRGGEFHQRDDEALLSSDWEAIAEDFNRAMEQMRPNDPKDTA